MAAEGHDSPAALVEARRLNAKLRLELAQVKGKIAASQRPKQSRQQRQLDQSVKQFTEAKKRILASLGSDSADASKKGSVDAPIAALLDYLNHCSDGAYVSTSSCSGRIAIFQQNDAQQKQSGSWPFVTHGIVQDADAVVAALPPAAAAGGTTSFKFEPFVLHVSCRSLADAQRLMKVVLGCGYKNSGMLVGKRFMVAVRSTLRLDVPVVFDGKIAVSSQYMHQLIALANEKMEENERRTNEFFDALKNEFGEVDT